MIRRYISSILKDYHARLGRIERTSKEAVWANIYHDSIRDSTSLKALSISPGRMAASYSMLFILFRVMSDYRPLRILEFGLGESTRMINTFMSDVGADFHHVVVEGNKDWIDFFGNRYKTGTYTDIRYMPCDKVMINGVSVNTHVDIPKSEHEKYDLYVIDGPNGSKGVSRYDIVFMIDSFSVSDDFIVIFDDYDREGEQVSAGVFLRLIREKGLVVYTGVYSGEKSQLVIATSKYRYATSF